MLDLMPMKISAKPARRSGGRWTARLASIAVVGLVALAACGNSKPSYCSTRATLQNDVKAFNTSSGVSGMKAQLTKIQNEANTLVSQAKSDFPSETSAITSSVDALSSSVKALPAHPSAAQIATVAKDASSVSSSVSTFVNASNSKCG